MSHEVARETDVPLGEVLRVQIGNEHIALFNLGGRLHATAAVCTHGLALLIEAQSKARPSNVRCVAGSFDIKTGAAVGAPCVKPIAVYRVKVENGVILVGLTELQERRG